MSTPMKSDVTTDGIRVVATAFFIPEKSNPGEREYLYGYTITMENVGETPCQLVSRRWTIIDSLGREEVVEGAGVVGQTPRLEPGQSFKYQSFCPLRTAWGTMEGVYHFKRDDGSMFDVRVGRFYLIMPKQEQPVGAR